MKKIIISLLISALIAPATFAATIISDYANIIAQTYVQQIAPMHITADLDNEITSEFGITLYLDNDVYILWNKVDTIFASGTAVTNERISAEITPEYADDYKSMYIPVNSDFMENEEVILTGLEMRTYDRSFSSKFIGVDIDEDDAIDFTDLNGYRVNDNERSDQTPPYPVYDVNYEVAEDFSSVHITWNNPPDYDVVSNNIERVLTRNGNTSGKTLELEGIFTELFTDEDVQEGDEITYYIYARDVRNLGEVYELNVIATPEEEVVEEEVVEEEPVEEELVEEEQDENDYLESKYNYYKIRYSIKCMPSGVAAASNDSACLWARIDLVYTQERLNEDDVDTELTDWDLELMEKRSMYSEARYIDNCEKTNEPASYCSALGKALDRVHYFIDDL